MGNIKLGKGKHHVILLSAFCQGRKDNTTLSKVSKILRCLCCLSEIFGTRHISSLPFRPSYRRRHPTFGQYRSDTERARLGDGGNGKRSAAGPRRADRAGRFAYLPYLQPREGKKAKSPWNDGTDGEGLRVNSFPTVWFQDGREGEGRIGERCILP